MFILLQKKRESQNAYIGTIGKMILKSVIIILNSKQLHKLYAKNLLSRSK